MKLFSFRGILKDYHIFLETLYKYSLFYGRTLLDKCDFNQALVPNRAEPIAPIDWRSNVWPNIRQLVKYSRAVIGGRFAIAGRHTWLHASALLRRPGRRFATVVSVSRRFQNILLPSANKDSRIPPPPNVVSGIENWTADRVSGGSCNNFQ